jgi:hypothetical protein
MRRKLQVEVTELIDELGPTLYDDFASSRIVPGSSVNPEHSGKSLGVGGDEESRLSKHPMGWLDEKLFGWRTRRRGSSKGKIEIGEEAVSENGDTESDDSESEIGDFDQAIVSLYRFQRYDNDTKHVIHRVKQLWGVEEINQDLSVDRPVKQKG